MDHFMDHFKIDFTALAKKFFVALLVCTFPSCFVEAQTIAEKKAGTVRGGDLNPEMQKFLVQVNKEIRDSHAELHRLYAKVHDLFDQNAPPSAYQELLAQINHVRENIQIIENSWREMASQGGPQEEYSLWHQPETTLGQLIIDYGSQNFVYLMSPEIAGMKLSMDSNLPIPRSSWGEMLEVILTQNGIGFSQLNPFLRQLFFLKENRSNIQLITNKRAELELFSPDTRVSFVLTPEPMDVRRIWLFMEKFVNPNSTILQLIGRDILIIGPVAEVKDMLKLYDFAAMNKGDKEYKVIPIRRIAADEMAKILAAIFDQTAEIPKAVLENKESQLSNRPRPPGPPGSPGFGPPSGPSSVRPPVPSAMQRPENVEINGLRIIPLAHIASAIFLVGTKEEIRRAEEIILQVEQQVGIAKDKVIYWYTAKHSDAEDLAEVLQKVYILMSKSGVALAQAEKREEEAKPPLPSPDEIEYEKRKEVYGLPSELYALNYYQQGNYVVNPVPVEPKKATKPRVNVNRENFIVDPKTGSIAMVVEAYILPKIKELIAKLDVPKKMVQMEILLFERRVTKEDKFGLNLLKIGNCASNTHSTCFDWNDPLITPIGVLEFLISRTKGALPAYDLTYQFLMTQDDLQINSAPSVVAVNQTPATIAIVDEISINTGIYNVETAKGVTLEQAFTRAQYGITISITPTIHMLQDDDEGDYFGKERENYVTLDTDITFDTIVGGADPQQPDVTRRHITNEARVPDGQTVILGGLRRKNTEDAREYIPFIGELPGIGKLFSMQDLTDATTEMFIFITPTIISDPAEDFERIKCEEMRRRPGDIPEFLCALYNARASEQDRIMVNTMDMLFGQVRDRCYSPSYWKPSTCGNKIIRNDFPCGEYDGRCGDCYGP